MRAYDPKTGLYKDQSIGDTPKIFSIDVDASPIKVVGAGCKNGGFYVLRADNGKIVRHTPVYNGPPTHPPASHDPRRTGPSQSHRRLAVGLRPPMALPSSQTASMRSGWARNPVLSHKGRCRRAVVSRQHQSIWPPNAGDTSGRQLRRWAALPKNRCTVTSATSSARASRWATEWFTSPQLAAVNSSPSMPRQACPQRNCPWTCVCRAVSFTRSGLRRRWQHALDSK